MSSLKRKIAAIRNLLFEEKEIPAFGLALEVAAEYGPRIHPEMDENPELRKIVLARVAEKLIADQRKHVVFEKDWEQCDDGESAA